MSNEYQKNMMAFKRALEDGLFENLEPGSWVAFARGRWIATVAADQEILSVHEVSEAEAPFIDRVNVD